MTSAAGSIYFHSPCFDGIVSAVLVWDFLDARHGLNQPALRPVNYHLSQMWIDTPLDQSSVRDSHGVRWNVVSFTDPPDTPSSSAGLTKSMLPGTIRQDDLSRLRRSRAA
jgi:hypothetical protein